MCRSVGVVRLRTKAMEFSLTYHMAESRPGHRLSWGLSWVSPVLPAKYRRIALKLGCNRCMPHFPGSLWHSRLSARTNCMYFSPLTELSQVKVTLRLTVSQSISLGVHYTAGSPSVYPALTAQAVKTTSQLELRNVFVFAAKTDTSRIGTSRSRADRSALERPSKLHEFVIRSARLMYTRLQ
jgi:hypothetical protein